MAFLLILDREHKTLWVKNKNKNNNSQWFLPEVEDPVNKPSNRLNVELLAKQAFIPLKSNLIGKKNLLDASHNDQIIYLFLCPGKEASEVLFDLTKYRDIQWIPVNCIKENDNFPILPGNSIVKAYHEILLNGFNLKNHNFHIVKNGQGKKEIENYNKTILQQGERVIVELCDQYSLYHQKIPQVGDYAFLNNWKGLPVAVLEITNIALESFDRISETLKKMNNNREYFSKEREKRLQKIFTTWCKNHNQKFSRSKEVILSQFKIIKQFKDSNMDYLRIP
jgi:uncharacterized protein YhfF